MSINPDAHSIDEIDLTRWGVEMARKGGVPPERVLNCKGLKSMAAYFEARRGARRTPAGSGVSSRKLKNTRAAATPLPKGRRVSPRSHLVR